MNWGPLTRLGNKLERGDNKLVIGGWGEADTNTDEAVLGSINLIKMKYRYGFHCFEAAASVWEKKKGRVRRRRRRRVFGSKCWASACSFVWLLCC